MEEKLSPSSATENVTGEDPRSATSDSTSADPTLKTADASFETLAEQPQVGIVQEFWEFLRYNKKWWLTPIIVILLALCLMVFLVSSPAAPFIYTLF